jgi:hypothetical protein
MIKYFNIKGIEIYLKRKNLPVFLGHIIHKCNTKICINNINIYIFNFKVLYKKIYIKPEKKKVQQLILNLRSIFHYSFNKYRILIKQSNFLLYK